MTEFAAVLNLSQASTTGYTQSRFSKVKIYYEELINTDAMEEELYGFTSLTSEIGGVAGLFLGCSVISLVELLWLFGLSVKSLFKSIGLRQLNTQKIADNRDNVELGYANEGVNNAPWNKERAIILASTIQLASVQNFYGEAMDNELYSLIGREAKYGAKHGKNYQIQDGLSPFTCPNSWHFRVHLTLQGTTARTIGFSKIITFQAPRYAKILCALDTSFKEVCKN